MYGFREKRVKKVRLTLCTLGTASFFTLKVSEILEGRRNATCEVRKLTVAKRQKLSAMRRKRGIPEGYGEKVNDQ